MERCEKLGLPPGREEGVPLPVRTAVGAGSMVTIAFMVHLMGLSEPG